MCPPPPGLWTSNMSQGRLHPWERRGSIHDGPCVQDPEGGEGQPPEPPGICPWLSGAASCHPNENYCWAVYSSSQGERGRGEENCGRKRHNISQCSNWLWYKGGGLHIVRLVTLCCQLGEIWTCMLSGWGGCCQSLMVKTHLQKLWLASYFDNSKLVQNPLAHFMQ